MAQPVWITPAGNLAPAAEGRFYSLALQAYDPDLVDTVYYELIAGALPDGMQAVYNPVLQIYNLTGVPTRRAVNITSKFAVRAYTTRVIGGITVVNRLADRTFDITVTVNGSPTFITPAGQIGQYYNGTLITDLQINYTNGDINDPCAGLVISLKAGSLPPGLTISTSGLISGFILLPNSTQGGYDASNFDTTPFDSLGNTQNTVYQFTLQVSDGRTSDLRTYTIEINSTTDLTADTTLLTADNIFVTADQIPDRPPVILTPQGSIGTVQSDNYFAFQFTAVQIQDLAYTFQMNGIVGSNIPGLTFDPGSGWLYGYIPPQGIYTQDYAFTIRAYLTSDPTVISSIYNYSLSVTGPVSSDVVWTSPAVLGSINNGDTSTFNISAYSISGQSLRFVLKSGSDSSLPQGLELLQSGDIVGRVSFDTFALDGGTTIFDGLLHQGTTTPTTFDMLFTFTVSATTTSGLIDANKTFTIRVVREYNEPYENLYIQAMPPLDDRALVNQLLQNSDIFPQSLIYRPDDPNFGVATSVIYKHAYGLTAATISDYYSALVENHYWRSLVLGEIKTAQALDGVGNVIYEVVYSEVIDDLVNSAGTSVNKQVTLPYQVQNMLDQTVQTVYPNSLQNMRTQVIDTVGQVSKILPRWMLSTQPNGTVLGFTPAWVIAYTLPGKSGQIAYNINSEFGINQLNKVDFNVDRYEIDRYLTKNWLPADTINITSVSGNGNVVTVTYSNQYIVPFAVNETITVADVVPANYNNTYIVSSCTPTTVQFTSNVTNAYVSGGTVSSTGTWEQFDNPAYANATPSLTTFDVINKPSNISLWTNYSANTVNWTNISANTVSWTNSYNGRPTIFDGNSLKFIAPVDMYEGATQIYDKYLVFDKHTILG